MQGFVGALPGAVSQGLIWGILAIGVYITYQILDIADLTVDGSVCTGAAVFVVLFTGGAGVWPALLAAFGAGMLAGLATGLLHTLCGIPAILAGILTQLGLWSVNLVIMGMSPNLSINVIDRAVLDRLLVSLRFVQDVAKGRRPVWQHPILVVGLITLVLVLALYWFFGTELGSALRATGSNSSMARAQGINTGAVTVLGLMLSNGLVALSGGLLAQYQSFADINMGRGAIVIGLAAVIIGQAVFGRLSANFGLRLTAVSLGAVIYYIVIQGVLELGLNSNYLKLLSAVVVALFLSLPHWKARYTARVRKGGPRNA